MKKICVIFAALICMIAMLAAVCAVAEGNPTERFGGRWQDPEYGRAMLKIRLAEGADAPEGGLWYDVRLEWGASADSEGVWTMSAEYDEAGDALIYRDGAMAIVTYGGDGEATEDRQWEDAEGRFTLAEDGRLLWTDSREERAADFAFERVPRQAPDAGEFRERYFEPVARQEPGTAGSSLKLALAAAEVLRFADEYCMWDADIPALRDNMLEAWTGLDETTRGRFDESLPDVMALMDEALSDYDSVAGQFESAGAAYMAYLARDGEAAESWRTLIGHTFTMGNSED